MSYQARFGGVAVAVFLVVWLVTALAAGPRAAHKVALLAALAVGALYLLWAMTRGSDPSTDGFDEGSQSARLSAIDDELLELRRRKALQEALKKDPEAERLALALSALEPAAAADLVAAMAKRRAEDAPSAVQPNPPPTPPPVPSGPILPQIPLPSEVPAVALIERDAWPDIRRLLVVGHEIRVPATAQLVTTLARQAEEALRALRAAPDGAGGSHRLFTYYLARAVELAEAFRTNAGRARPNEERAGQLHDMLARLSDVFDHHADRQMEGELAMLDLDLRLLHEAIREDLGQ